MASTFAPGAELANRGTTVQFLRGPFRVAISSGIGLERHRRARSAVEVAPSDLDPLRYATKPPVQSTAQDQPRDRAGVGDLERLPKQTAPGSGVALSMPCLGPGVISGEAESEPRARGRRRIGARTRTEAADPPP